MTNTKAFNSIKNVELAPPSIDTLRDIYNGLRETFASYTEQMILYYLYKLSPVNENFKTQDLLKVIREDLAQESAISHEQGK